MGVSQAGLFGAVAAIVLVAGSSPTSAVTLREAMTAAARSNPTLQTVREAARAGHEGVSMALSEWLPTISVEGAGSGGLEHSRSSSNAPSLFAPLAPLARRLGAADIASDLEAPPGSQSATTRSNRQSLDLTYSHNLYRSGGSTARLDQAKHAVRHSHARVEDVEQSVFLGVAIVYLDVLRAAWVVALREGSLAFFEQRVSETEALFRVKDRTEADVAQARAEREAAVADVEAARADLEVQISLFASRVGIPPHDLRVVGEPSNLPASLDAARERAEADRPAVRMARHAVSAAQYGVKLARSTFGPSVDLRAQAGIGREWMGRPNSSSTTVTRQGVVLLSMRMPLYQAGSAKARLREMQGRLAQSWEELTVARREASHRTTAAWRRLEAARQRRAALAVAVKASQIALAGIRREAQIDARTVREVLDAERILTGQRIQELTAYRDSIVEAYRLLDAVGALTARRLGIKGVPDLVSEARETARAAWLPLWAGGRP